MREALFSKNVFFMRFNIYKFLFQRSNNYNWIVFFRISFGFFILLHFISILPDFSDLFSKQGIIPSDILDVYVPNFVLTLPKIIDKLEFFGFIESNIIIIFKLCYILLSVFIIVGLYPRITAFLLLFLQISLIKGGSFYAYGVDFFTSMSLFYLLLIPSHYKMSVHTFFRHQIKEINITPYRRLFQIHLTVLYFFSGFDKLLGFNWRNGESIWKAINLPSVNQDFNFDFEFLADYPIALVAIGWVTIIIEMCYPIFIWYPKTQFYWLILIVSMHLGIALVLNLYFFSALMIIWNITNFYYNKK